MGFYERYWEMQEGGPYAGQDDQDPANKIFKCKDCGAETHAHEGWDGEPEAELCSAECPSRASDWRPGKVSNAFRRNIGAVRFDPEVTGLFDVHRRPDVFKEHYDGIFPDAPGTGI